MDLNEGMKTRAQDLGRQIGQTDEYKALARAREAISSDKACVSRLNKLSELEREISSSLQQGVEPAEAIQQEYETLFQELQTSPLYQALAAGQSNFDKTLMRVNEEIGRGIELGAQSRIILS
ncbi:MAG: YlbF family regulator [Longimicrobiales bacterium]